MLVNSMSNYHDVGTTSMNPSNYSNNFLPTNINSNNNSNSTIIATTTNASQLVLNSLPPAPSPETKALAACKSHKEAERRRRRRINAHLSTLRTLLPNHIKADKASVLGEVVRCVRELKKSTSELTADDNSDAKRCKPCLLPGDTDEIKLRRCENDNNILVATLCCEDRPELIVDLTRALRSVKAKITRVEMATVGGRTKTILWVRGISGGGPEGLLKRALKVVVDKPPSSSNGIGLGLIASRMHGFY